MTDDTRRYLAQQVARLQQRLDTDPDFRTRWLAKRRRDLWLYHNVGVAFGGPPESFSALLKGRSN